MPTILVVDDDPSIRALLELTLSEFGDVVAVADGPAALASTDAMVPDVAILDVMMPEVSGTTVLERWRTDEHTRTMPVIMLSARDQILDRADGYRAGADAYVTKPFEVDVLMTAVQTLLVERDDAGDLLAELRARAGFG